MPIEYSKNLANKIQKLIDANEWHAAFDESRGSFELNFKCEKFKVKRLRLVICVHEDDYRVYTFPDLTIDMNDSHLVARVTEYILRVNDGAANGLFSLDFDNGIISYKTFASCRNGDIDSDDFFFNTVVHMFMFDTFGNGLLEIIYSNANVESVYLAAKRSNN